MSIKKRLEALENRHSQKRYFVAHPIDYEDDSYSVAETGKDAVVMTNSELTAWEAKQPANVMLLKLVYEDVLKEQPKIF